MSLQKTWKTLGDFCDVEAEKNGGSLKKSPKLESIEESQHVKEQTSITPLFNFSHEQNNIPLCSNISTVQESGTKTPEGEPNKEGTLNGISCKDISHCTNNLKEHSGNFNKVRDAITISQCFFNLNF